MKSKVYKVGYYQARFGADGKSGSLAEMLHKVALDKGMPQSIACGDHLVQIRGLVSVNDGKEIRGHVVRFRDDSPLVTRQDSPEETPLELKPGDELVERNHFVLYRERAGLEILVYQAAWEGTLPSVLARYLSVLNAQQATITFDEILTKDAYEALANGGLIKSVEFRVARPQRKSYVPDPEDQWTQEGISFMKGTGATSFQVKISTRRPDKGLMIDVSKRIKFLLDSVLTKKLVVKMSNMEEPIDLFAQRVSDRISIQLVKGQADPLQVYVALANSKMNTQPRLDEIFGLGDEALE